MSEIKTIYIIWDDIIFAQDEIQFDITRLKTILQPVTIKGLIKSLNIIKGEYFDRLYGKKAFKLSFLNGKLLQSKTESPGWSRLLDAIELVHEYYALKFINKEKGIVRRSEKLTNEEVMDVYEGLLSNTDYLKYLAQRINTEFRLIPVLEYSNGHVEESFLFRFKNKRGDVLIIWENVNPSRATYIFKYNEQKHSNVLQRIESFIASEEYDHKRSMLSGSDLIAREIKRSLCFYKRYAHYGTVEFKSEIEYLIAYS